MGAAGGPAAIPRALSTDYVSHGTLRGKVECSVAELCEDILRPHSAFLLVLAFAVFSAMFRGTLIIREIMPKSENMARRPSMSD